MYQHRIAETPVQVGNETHFQFKTGYSFTHSNDGRNSYAHDLLWNERGGLTVKRVPVRLDDNLHARFPNFCEDFDLEVERTRTIGKASGKEHEIYFVTVTAANDIAEEIRKQFGAEIIQVKQ